MVESCYYDINFSHGSEHGPPDADATLTEAAEDLARSPSPTPAEKDLLVQLIMNYTILLLIL